MYTLDLQSTQKQWQMTVYRDLLLKIDNPTSDCYWVGGRTQCVYIRIRIHTWIIYFL